MKRFKIILNQYGSWITPPTADTWFGHLCWAYKYLFGEQELEKLLEEFSTETVPWKISDAFPEDFFPMPVLPMDVDFGDQTKEFKKEKFIYEEIFKELEFFSYGNLWEKLPVKKANGSEILERKINFGFAPENLKIEKSVKVDLTHNTIDRVTGSTLDEGRFFHTVSEWVPKNSKLQIFVDVYNRA